MTLKKSLYENQVIFLIVLKVLLSIFLVVNNYFYNVYSQGTLSPEMNYTNLDENIQYINSTVSKKNESGLSKVLDFVGLGHLDYVAGLMKQIIEYVFVTFYSFFETLIRIIFPSGIEEVILNSTLYKVISFFVLLLDLVVSTYVLFVIVRSFITVFRW